MNNDLAKPGEKVIQTDPEGKWVMIEGADKNILRVRMPDGTTTEHDVPRVPTPEAAGVQPNITSKASTIQSEVATAAATVATVASLASMAKGLFDKFKKTK